MRRDHGQDVVAGVRGPGYAEIETDRSGIALRRHLVGRDQGQDVVAVVRGPVSAEIEVDRSGITCGSSADGTGTELGNRDQYRMGIGADIEREFRGLCVEALRHEGAHLLHVGEDGRPRVFRDVAEEDDGGPILVVGEMGHGRRQLRAEHLELRVEVLHRDPEGGCERLLPRLRGRQQAVVLEDCGVACACGEPLDGEEPHSPDGPTAETVLVASHVDTAQGKRGSRCGLYLLAPGYLVVERSGRLGVQDPGVALCASEHPLGATRAALEIAQAEQCADLRHVYVDEQRFCQCNGAATPSVSPRPLEDAVTPFRRPGTPLART